MLRAFPAFVTGSSLVIAIAACTGGPGPLPDGSSEGNTGGSETTTGASSSSGDTTDNPPSNVSSTSSSSSSGSSGGNCTVSVAGLDTSCASDTDCTLVYAGQIGACMCSNYAINKKDLTKYETQATQGNQGCTTAGSSSGGQCSCPTTIRPTCNTSTKRCVVTTGTTSSSSSGSTDAGF